MQSFFKPSTVRVATNLVLSIAFGLTVTATIRYVENQNGISDTPLGNSLKISSLANILSTIGAYELLNNYIFKNNNPAPRPRTPGHN